MNDDGHFCNQVIPSSIGGDVIRGLLAGRSTGDMAGAISSIALERIAGFMALLTLIVIGQPLLIARLNDSSLSWLALAVAVGGLCVILAPFIAGPLLERHLPGRPANAVRRFCNDARRLVASPLLASLVLVGAFIMHGTTLILTATIANQLGAHVSLLDVLLVMPTVKRWSRLFEQIFRFDKWSVCRG